VISFASQVCRISYSYYSSIYAFFRVCCCRWMHFFQWLGHHISSPCQSSAGDHLHTYGPETPPLSDAW
jgi:hypothetical protein